MSDNNLELTIGANIDPFLDEIALMEKDYQDAVKQIEGTKAEVKLKTSFDISAARAVGDKMGEIVARNKELDNLIKLQTAKVKVLKKQWDEVKKSKDANIDTIKKMEKEYMRASIQLNNLTEKRNRGGIMGNLSILAPDTFRKIEQAKNAIASVGAEIPEIGKIVPVLGAIATGFTVAGTAATAYFSVLKKADEYTDKAMQDLSAYGEEIYKLKEQLGINGQEAVMLNDIVKLDGTDIAGLTKSVVNLRLALKTNSEAGKRAQETAEKYGESLKDANGNAKSFMKVLETISRVYAKAVQESPAKGLEVMANTLGAKGVQFTSFFSSFDQHAESSKKVKRAIGDISDATHAAGDEANRAKLQYEQESKAIEAKLLPRMHELYAFKKNVSGQKVELGLARDAEMDKFAEKTADMSRDFAKFSAIVDAVKMKLPSFFDSIKTGPEIFKEEYFKDFSYLDVIGKMLGLDFKKAAEEAAETTKKAYKDKGLGMSFEDVVSPEQEQREREAKANAELEKMIWNIKASDYEKELAKIDEVAQKQKEAGASEVKIAEYVAEAKAQLDEKYAKKKDNKEVEKARKEAEARVQAARQATEQIQTVWMTETQRRLAEIEKQKQAWIKAGADEVAATQAAEKQKREARMSEAERTLQQNLKTIRAMQKAEAQGQDPYAAGRQYMEKQYMKQNGFRYSDFAGLQRYGVENLQSMMQAMKESLYGGFAGGSNTVNSNNNTTINIDRPVLTDENLVNQLADKVADKILPIFTQQNLGYKGA